ncbi:MULTISPECIES: STM4014 family protein [Catenuloplanes]|uniref:Glutathione synthase/RimK-type ligase-like ATP-grasp enzyme n=1 Tax=Catenuloplanes niger TaxID=587534 RepID=A0AAE3ZXH0_9ACTN|nr:STM4014 family protein [Catenuloplanes niger]MDR7326645.1 glutathione synthase/RimK-type ligase-like ATP-grasp enzyme [Catenuloplanes niger]
MSGFAVLGNPANRRVTSFAAAVTAAGLPPPRVYAWRDVLTGGPVPGPGERVRVDSPGEDAEVGRLLRGAVRAAAHGEITGTAAAHAGLGAALRRVEAGGGTLLSAPDDILTMSDKPRCHALLREHGVPVPEALAAVSGYAELRAAMRAAGWARVFVKPSHGSSASGVLALTAAPGRVAAVTSVERGPGGRLFNNLTLRRYDREADVAAIVDTLAGDGLHVERWFPKAGLGGRTVDLRVVVIAGEARHVVVRASRSPLTNLHLGNARGDVAEVRARAGARVWDAAMETCARVGAAFPRTLMAGVDLMIHAAWRRHAVAEVNAFGDLLPGVLHRGEDTYTAQVRAALCAS